MTGDRRRALRPDRGRLVVGIAALVAFALGGSVLWSSQQDRADLAGQVAAQGETLDEFAEAVATLSGQVEALGGEPAVELEDGDAGPEPVEVPGPPGPPGPPPSEQEVRLAVERYCAANGCTGPQGPAPSATQVAAAVAAYCDNRGQCRGQAGTNGTAGEDGEPGATGPQGPAGPGPSDDQVAAAVATYCAAHDGCRGPAGPTGDPGSPGDTGAPGATGPAPQSWTFTYLGVTWSCTDPDGDLAYQCEPT